MSCAPLRAATLVALSLLTACGPSTGSSSGEEGSSTSGGPVVTGTGAATGTSTTATATSDAPTTTLTTTVDTTTGAATCEEPCTGDRTSFVDESGVDPDDDCNQFLQDCPEGQKCTPVDRSGSMRFDDIICVPVMGDKLPGEACTAETLGFDDCQKGATCWPVDADNHGVCAPLCVWNEDSRTCSDPQQECAEVDSGLLYVCVDPCQPLIQDCPNGGLCLPVPWTYSCFAPDPGVAGAVFEPCDGLLECAAGLVCAGSTVASECDQGLIGCCTPMCSIAEAGAGCPGADQQCHPVYEPQPAGFEDVGYCGVRR